MENKKELEMLKNITKNMVLHCFRNTHLENLHAGEKCGGAGGGFSNKEMKKLMIEVNDKLYTMLCFFENKKNMSDIFINWIILNQNSTSKWNKPKLYKQWVK